MHSAEEQVYIALVAVKRPAIAGRPDLDPGAWAQHVMNGLGETGAQQLRATGYAWRSERARSRLPRGVYAVLGTLCLAGATWLCYLGVK